MRPNLPVVVIAIVVAMAPGPVRANDGAAEVGVGGIQLRNERRVAMRKERLFISLDKVRVEYEFVNESAEDVATEIAFPTPDMAFSPAERIGHRFQDFKAWVNDTKIEVKEEARAIMGDRDVAGQLKAVGLTDIAGSLRQVEQLPVDKKEQLHAQGLLGWGDSGEARYWPHWTVRIVYHWVQRFPPGQVVRIRHEYAPAHGDKNHVADDLFDDACADPPLRARLISGRDTYSPNQGWTRWVKYILTTANTWKTPIRDFELELEFPEGEYVSLCWDGNVELDVDGKDLQFILEDGVVDGAVMTETEGKLNECRTSLGERDRKRCRSPVESSRLRAAQFQGHVLLDVLEDVQFRERLDPRLQKCLDAVRQGNETQESLLLVKKLFGRVRLQRVDSLGGRGHLVRQTLNEAIDCRHAGALLVGEHVGHAPGTGCRHRNHREDIRYHDQHRVSPAFRDGILRPGHGGRQEQKNRRVRTPRGHSNTPVYSPTGPPTRTGCPLSSHPTTAT